MKKGLLLFPALLVLAACSPAEEKGPTLTSPVSKMDDVYQGTTVTIPSVTAYDEHDGDLTSKILTVVRNPSSTVITPENNKFVCDSVGKYSITFSVENSLGKDAKLLFEFQSIDAQSPIISLATDPLPNGYLGEQYVLPNATATDPNDGDISSKVIYTVKDASNNNVPLTNKGFIPASTGEYTATFSVTNTLNKSTSLTRKFNILEAAVPVITGDVEKIPTMYLSQTLTLPKISVTDRDDPTVTKDKVALEVTYPDLTKAQYTASTLPIEQVGEYVLTYSVTNSHNKVGKLEYRFEAKRDFVIGWSNSMYTGGISGLTPTIMEAYKTYVTSNVNFNGIDVRLVGFDNTDYPTLATEITSAKCDVLVGFTKSLYVEVSGTTPGGNLESVNKEAKEIGMITNRYISQQNDSTLSKQVYDLSLTNPALETLKVKKIVIVWYGDNNAATDERMAAVDAKLETYLASQQYTIDVASQKITKGSSSYDDVHTRIVNAEAVYGLNWGSNFNLASGFKFLSARMGSGFAFGTVSSRYVTGMIKDGNDYSFYSTLFNYIKSDEMKAVYTA